MQNSNHIPIKNTKLTALIWLIVVVLFLLQAFVFIGNAIVVSLMLLVFLFIAFPVSLLCVMDWLKFLATKSNRRWLSPLISYLCVAGFIYGVGLFVGYLTEHKIAYLGLKMVVFFTIVGVMWGLMVWSANRVCLRLSQKLVQKGIVLSAFINKLLAYGIVLLIGFVIRLLIEKTPLVEWVF